MEEEKNNRVWSQGKNSDMVPSRLLVQRGKFAPHVTVSAGVSFEGNGRLHFVEEKAKINANYYINNLLPNLLKDADALLRNNFVSQKDGALAHGTM